MELFRTEWWCSNVFPQIWEKSLRKTEKVKVQPPKTNNPSGISESCLRKTTIKANVKVNFSNSADIWSWSEWSDLFDMSSRGCCFKKRSQKTVTKKLSGREPEENNEHTIWKFQFWFYYVAKLQHITHLISIWSSVCKRSETWGVRREQSTFYQYQGPISRCDKELGAAPNGLISHLFGSGSSVDSVFSDLMWAWGCCDNYTAAASMRNYQPALLSVQQTAPLIYVAFF